MTNWTTDQIEFVKTHYSSLGTKACAAVMHVNKDDLRRLANKLGLKISSETRSRVMSEATRKYRQANPKTEGFKIDPAQFVNPQTKEAIYFLGLLWADGWIRREGRHNTIAIECLAEDGRVLAPYLRTLGQWAVGIRQRRRKGKPFGRPQMKHSTNNKPLLDLLYSLDYGRKSLASPDKVLSTIPESLHFYFWRGYLDGDGSISVNKEILKSWQCQVAFWGTFEQDWTGLLHMLERAGVRKHFIHQYERAKSNGVIHRSSVVAITRKDDVMRLLEYIYQGEPIGLTRKRAKYDEMVAALDIKKAKRTSPTRSIYRGVRRVPLHEGGERWAARLKHNKRVACLGHFDTAEEAALAYNAKAIEVWGPSAILNQVNDDPALRPTSAP